MAKEAEKAVAKEEAENSSSIKNVGGDESDVEEGEIVAGNSDDAKALKAMAPRHPLEHAWTFWFDSPSNKQKQTAWGSSMQPIYTFSTIEDFWGVYNNIHRPSKLVTGTDFHCFKNKIEPKWEDPVCANGGTWTLAIPKIKCDTLWLYTLLAMIGEQFDYGDEICGAVVNVRARQDRIVLWTKNAANEAAQLSIGKQWKEFLDYKDSIGFIFNEEATRLDKCAKNRYTV